MNGKKLIFAVIALVVAVLIIVLGEQLGKKKPSDKTQQFFPSLTQKDISAFEITDSEGKIRLERKGDIWIIGSNNNGAQSLNPMNSNKTNLTSQVEYKADSASIISVLDKIVSIKKGEPISQNPEKQTLFEVDTAKGLLVEVFDNTGSSKGSFRIGKSGPDYSSNYVRMTGSNSVYMVPGSIKMSFFTEGKRWRDKSIIKFDRSTAKGITIVKDDESKIVMEKDTGTTWLLKEPIEAPAKGSEIESMLSKLSNFMSSDIDTAMSADSITGLSTPKLAIAITFSNGTTKNVIFGGKQNADDQYSVKVDGKEHIYLVDGFEIDTFNKKPEELKDDTPPPATDSTAAAPAK